MKRAALYVRVSTQEQKKHGLSVDSQLDALNTYCIEHQYMIAGVYNDAGFSARKKYKSRPALLRLLDDCKAGKVDIILFTKLDRWFRSVPDYYEVQTQLEACNVPWRAIWEDYETETSAGVFKVNIMLSVAQSEADRTSERLKAVNAYRRAQGAYIGSAPTGYKVVGKDLIIDEEKRAGMTALFDTLKSTLSVADALKAAAAHGVRFEQTHLYRLLRSPAFHGDAYGYKCEAYISPEDHQRILDSFASKPRRPKVKDRVYLFTSLVFCGYCGRRMASKTVKRTYRNGKTHLYAKYECIGSRGTKSGCPHLQITERMLEEYLLGHLDSELSAYSVHIRAKKDSMDISSALRLKSKIEAKLTRLAELYTEGDISKNEYEEKRDDLKAQLAGIVIEQIPEPEDLPSDWKELYNRLDASHRQAFWRRVISRIEITNETKDHPVIFFS